MRERTIETTAGGERAGMSSADATPPPTATRQVLPPGPVTSPTDSGPAAGLGRRLVGLLGRGDGDAARLLILVLLVAALGLMAPSFLSKASWIATSQSSTVILLLAVGQAFVIVTGGIDLSVGAVLACSSMVAAVTMRAIIDGGAGPTVTIVVGFAVGIVAGALMGLVNGLVITRLSITPFIATLGMLGVATGATNLLSNGTEIVGLPPGLGVIGNTLLGGFVTIPVLVTAAITVLAGLVLARTRFGLRTYAIGSNASAARRSGISTNPHLVTIYVLSGTLASIAGLLLMSRFVGASPLAGQNAELASIAAAVIGGASLTGGRGSVVGAAIGALITGVLQIGLILAGVASFWQTLVIGLIIVVAVYGDQVRVRLQQD